MKTIIAPTDFSTASVNACLYAAKLAADIKADLVLLHAMGLPIPVAEYPATDVLDEAGIVKELESLKTKLSSETDNKVTIMIRNIVGSAEYEIKELCKTSKPFAVVMATNSNKVLDRFFLGSTTAYSAKHLRYPVIIIPHNANYKPIKKIALASDLRNVYEVPAGEIEAIVKLFHAEFEVFYAAKNEMDLTRNYIGNVLLNHRLHSLNPQFHVVKNEEILIGITNLAKKHNIDMLMIIPKKHGPFHKSQSREFVFYSDVPTMAIHENDLVPEL